MKNEKRIVTAFEADMFRTEELMAEGRRLHDQAIAEFILGLFKGNSAAIASDSWPKALTVFDSQDTAVAHA